MVYGLFPNLRDVFSRAVVALGYLVPFLLLPPSCPIRGTLARHPLTVFDFFFLISPSYLCPSHFTSLF
ncbi:hypothetical protein F4775DRAFT_549039 [Biscogniauxia sp. FL1348]|nr:hypothetical protein F4775DRAFT_549039 [Biscogniauxia sp. FL1348]